MKLAKDTLRAKVSISFDGFVHKYFKGPQAKERFENECRVLDYLQQHQCAFVPHLLEACSDQLYIKTSNCGAKVEHLSSKKILSIFDELEQYGVRHEDAALRNITYNERLGRFCVIDFEFATILEAGYPPSPEMKSHANRDLFRQDT